MPGTGQGTGYVMQSSITPERMGDLHSNRVSIGLLLAGKCARRQASLWVGACFWTICTQTSTVARIKQHSLDPGFHRKAFFLARQEVGLHKD